MSAPKRATAGRIMAALPAMPDRLRVQLSDVPKNTFGNCLRSLIWRRQVKRLDSGLLVAGDPEIKRPYVPRTRNVPIDDPKSETAPAKTAVWAERPEMSPQVSCPARVTVGLSTCLDDYTAAASGHRSGPVECARCSVGRRRRMELAWGATC